MGKHGATAVSQRGGWWWVGGPRRAEADGSSTRAGRYTNLSYAPVRPLPPPPPFPLPPFPTLRRRAAPPSPSPTLASLPPLPTALRAVVGPHNRAARRACTGVRGVWGLCARRRRRCDGAVTRGGTGGRQRRGLDQRDGSPRSGGGWRRRPDRGRVVTAVGGGGRLGSGGRAGEGGSDGNEKRVEGDVARPGQGEGGPTAATQRHRRDVKWEAGYACCRPWHEGAATLGGGRAGRLDTLPAQTPKRADAVGRVGRCALPSAELGTLPATCTACMSGRRGGRSVPRVRGARTPRGREGGSPGLRECAAEKPTGPWITRGACRGRFPPPPHALSPHSTGASSTLTATPWEPRARKGGPCHSCWCLARPRCGTRLGTLFRRVACHHPPPLFVMCYGPMIGRGGDGNKDKSGGGCSVEEEVAALDRAQRPTSERPNLGARPHHDRASWQWRPRTG